MVRGLVAVILLVLPPAPGADRGKKAADKEAVLEAARAAREASRTYDVARIDQLLAEDFLAIDPAGSLRNKTEYLEMIRSIPPELKQANAELQVSQQDVRVRQYGNVAVITELRKVMSGPDSSEARYTQVWVKDKGAWRLSTMHASRTADPSEVRSAGLPAPAIPR
jgi:ketosteroid isomerase-like protein